MAFSDFTLEDVTRQFQLSTEESQDLHGETPEVEVGAWLAELLREYHPLAKAIGTEKARSEFLIAPILAEVRKRLNHRVGLFSGADFPAAPELGLNGVCDFLLTRSPEQFFIKEPIAVIVEAKREDLKTGLGQCASAMIGARFFNERRNTPIETIHGAVTSGTVWQFLRLEGQTISLDANEYYLENVGKILGILIGILSGENDRGRLVA